MALSRGCDRGKGRGHRSLLSQGAVLNRRGWLLGVASSSDQRSRVIREALDAHVEDKGAGEGRKGHPVKRGLGLARILVAGDEGDRGGLLAVGYRDPGVGGGRRLPAVMPGTTSNSTPAA